MKHFAILYCTLISCTFTSCGNRVESSGPQGDTIPMRHARNLTLIQYPNYVEAVLRNPWDTAQVLARYEIRQPLRRAAVFSSVHVALLEELGVADCITGVCDPQYISSPDIQRALQTGRIRNLGASFQPTHEAILDLQPDALMPSAFENNGGYGGLDKLNVPIIPCADYMEVSPLARAEWMRFYGRLFGYGKQADSLFSTIEQEYLRLKAMAQDTQQRPTLLSGIPYQGTWHVVCGQSTTAQLINDAGGNYVFSVLTGTGSRAMSLESVLNHGINAQMWLFVSNSTAPITLKQMAQDNTLYTHFQAYKTGEIYLCDANKTRFFEQTPFHPERLLASMIALLHPETGLRPDIQYYSPVPKQ